MTDLLRILVCRFPDSRRAPYIQGAAIEAENPVGMLPGRYVVVLWQSYSQSGYSCSIARYFAGAGATRCGRGNTPLAAVVSAVRAWR